MSTIFDQMLSRYEIKTNEDKHNAQHEVIQQITLSALNRADFFNTAAFYGGTCLRIFYELQRFSEDMDFSLLEKDQDCCTWSLSSWATQPWKLLGRSGRLVV